MVREREREREREFKCMKMKIFKEFDSKVEGIKQQKHFRHQM